MQHFLNSIVAWTTSTDTDDNAASVVTLTAAAEERYHVGQIDCGYDLDPTGDASLTIAYTERGTAKTWKVPIKSGGLHAFDKTGIIVGDKNTTITITLSASGAATNVGFLNVHWA